MSLFGKIGKAAFSAVTGISLPPSEGELRYNEYQDALDTIFQVFEKVDPSAEWKNALNVLKETASGTLREERVRKSIEASICVVEYARIYMNVLSSCVGVERLKNFADENGQKSNYEYLVAMVNLTLAICNLIDQRIEQSGLTKEEDRTFRMLFDVFCTRQPLLSIVRFQQSDNDIPKTLDVILDTFFTNERMAACFERECADRGVDFYALKHKFGC